MDTDASPTIDMTAITDAYERRSADYIDAVGSVEAAHPLDRLMISEWARSLTGPVVDAGCGPGQWTEHLGRIGLTVTGVDVTPAFLRHARQTFSRREFRHCSLDTLPAPTASLGGVLAWFSLIHREPASLPTALREFRRVLREPGGRLLVGFFTGAELESFDHAVVTAYRWPVDAMCRRLTDAGFTVLEIHTRQLRGERPGAAIIAGTEPDDRPLSR